MPVTKFRLRLVVKGQENFQRLKNMVQDCRELFNAIVDRWISHNVVKFESSRGAETTGVQFDGDTFWMPLSDRYRATKQRQGFEDWLMVRTGELRASLTERDAFGYWEEIGPASAAFGTLLKKAQWNVLTRPVMFLDETDQAMIEDLTGAWLNGEAPFAPYRPGEVERMDREFQAVINPIGEIRPIAPTLPPVAPARG